MTKQATRLVVAICALSLTWAAACDKDEPTLDGEHAAAHAPQNDDKHGDDEQPTDEQDDHAGEAHVGQAPTSADELPEGVNAVQHEMRLLDEAMGDMLTLIANNQLDGIPAHIKKVHSARLITEDAIEQGVYQPPKNSEDIDGFVALDDAFHDDLKKLVKASKTDDLQLATDAFGELVQGCTSCHTTYRF